MKHLLLDRFETRPSADALIIPFWQGEKGIEPAAPIVGCEAWFQGLFATSDFRAKASETALLYPEGAKESRCLLVGLGKPAEASLEVLRRAFSMAVRSLRSKSIKKLNLCLPQCIGFSKEEMVQAIVEGVLLTNYSFTRLKGSPSQEVSLQELAWIGEGLELSWIHEAETLSQAVGFVRDLVNDNADHANPQGLADAALSLKKIPQVKVDLFDRKWLEQEKMGLLLAVARGASVDPFLLKVSYHGDPQSKEHVVLVGKGVTYDTGGLSLKNNENMLTMKCDMAGAATVLGVIHAAASLQLKVNVTALAPVTENAIGPKSYKVGDVYRSYSGKSVEIQNTDAEGRLILADALSYAVKKLSPTALIDIASLTGSMVIALGESVAGFCSQSEEIAQTLLQASQTTSEPLWRMPLVDDYEESLKSDIADLVNIGGREGGGIKAALFLKEFVNHTPWAHIDFAGPCYVSKPKHYHTTKATGYGVRLLIDFLKKRRT